MEADAKVIEEAIDEGKNIFEEVTALRSGILNEIAALKGTLSTS